jgi:hypothetical protein
MGMNKNTVLGWATFIMILMGLLLIGLVFRYSEVSGWDLLLLSRILANAWVFSSLKGRLKSFKIK